MSRFPRTLLASILLSNLLSTVAQGTGNQGGEEVAADQETFTVSEETLAGKQFQFSWHQGTEHGVNGVATLSEDGTIVGIPSPNEATWEVDSKGCLVFKDRSGNVSTIFTQVKQRHGLLLLSGPFQLRERITHQLEEIDEARGIPVTRAQKVAVEATE